MVTGPKTFQHASEDFALCQVVKHTAPQMGGRFAMWGGCFSATICALEAIRKKEDSYNPIAAGFVTGVHCPCIAV